MNLDEQKHLLALSYVPGIGIQRFKKLVEHYQSATKVFDLSAEDLVKDTNVPYAVAKKIKDEKFISQAQRELQLCKEQGYKVYSILDESYPKLLKECSDAPPFIFSRGNINWNKSKFVSIVGTRRMTNYGKNFVQKLVETFKNLDICVVSGLALGVDVTAHKAALDNNLQTIGVLAHGVNQILPKANVKTGLEMLNHGGIISEFSSFHKPEPENFKKRNRIIAGLSHATIVIESDLRGGAMSTATHANLYNRDVFAVPGRTSDKYSRGCHQLIKNHKAYLITEGKDVLTYLNLSPKKTKPKQKELFIELSDLEQQLYDLLNKQGKMHIDAISLELEVSGFQLLPTLLDLELKNIIRPLSGKMYELS